MLQHTSFMLYEALATLLQSVCASVWKDCGLRNSSTEAAQGGFGRARGLSVFLIGLFFVFFSKWQGYSMFVCVEAWQIAATSDHPIYPSIAPSLPASTHPSNTWYFYSSGHLFTCMGLSFIYPIHQFVHSSIYLLIHPLFELVSI